MGMFRWWFGGAREFANLNSRAIFDKSVLFEPIAPPEHNHPLNSDLVSANPTLSPR